MTHHKKHGAKLTTKGTGKDYGGVDVVQEFSGVHLHYTVQGMVAASEWRADLKQLKERGNEFNKQLEKAVMGAAALPSYTLLPNGAKYLIDKMVAIRLMKAMQRGPHAEDGVVFARVVHPFARAQRAGYKEIRVRMSDWAALKREFL